MSIDVIVPDSARQTYENWHFAPAVRHGDIIFCSGVIGQGETAEEEFRSAWQSLGKTLAAASGLSIRPTKLSAFRNVGPKS